MYLITDSVFYGYQTQTAGTVIQQLIRPFKGARTKVTGLRYTNAGTEHTVTVKMMIGTTKLSANAASGQAVLTLAAQPTAARNIAVNDYIVVERQETASGMARQTWSLYKLHASTAPVANAGGTVTVTLAANVAGAHVTGQKVWLMSLAADVVPGYGATPPLIKLPVSVTTEMPSNALSASGGLAGSWSDYEPVVLEIDNITAAGFLQWVTAVGLIVSPGRNSR